VAGWSSDARLYVDAAFIHIDIDDNVAELLNGVRWAIVDYTPHAQALIRIENWDGSVLYGQPDPRHKAAAQTAPPT